jgi:hypothetical protein
MSHFICHQHRPELIWVPQWQHHENGAHAVTCVSYVAKRPRDLLPRFEAMYAGAVLEEDGLMVDTGCGLFRVLTPEAVTKHYGHMPLPRWPDHSPHGIAITLATSRFDELEPLWKRNGVDYRRSPSNTLLLEPRLYGNVILEFAP